MKKTILEKYYDKGWLKRGSGLYSAEDRLWAGRFFYADFEKSRVRSEGVRDMATPFVEGGLKVSSVESRLAAKDRFMKVCKCMDLGQRSLMMQVVIENKDAVGKGVFAKEMKKRLCRALDCLVFYYAKKRESKNEERI